MKARASLLAVSAVLMAVGIPLMAQAPTSSGTLNITGSIEPTISLTFISDPSGVTLTGSATATATLPFGTVQAYDYTAPSGVTQVVNGSGASATNFYVSTPFDVLVMKANTASANYTLTATLTTLDGNNTWTIDGGVDVSDGAQKTVTSTGTYGSAISHTLKILIPFTNTSLSLNNSIGFTATAN